MIGSASELPVVQKRIDVLQSYGVGVEVCVDPLTARRRKQVFLLLRHRWAVFCLNGTADTIKKETNMNAPVSLRGKNRGFGLNKEILNEP